MFDIIWGFIVSHQTLFAALGVAIFDLLFALKPNWASNGILHWIYLVLVGKKS